MRPGPHFDLRGTQKTSTTYPPRCSLASGWPVPERVRLVQFHIIQLSTITYGFFGFRAVFLLS